MTRRVVVTGMGTVTPHADDVDRLFEQLCAGVSAVRRIECFDPSAVPSQIAAEVLYDLDVPETYGPWDLRSRAMRFTHAAGTRALASAGLPAPPDDDHAARARRAVHLAIGVGSTAMEALGPATVAAWGAAEDRGGGDAVAFRAAAAHTPDDAAVLEEWFVDQAAPLLAAMFGASSVTTAASACASGSHAVLDAVHRIRLDQSDVVLTGGVCTPITRSMMPGFAMLSALTTNNDPPAAASRPFDAGRSGFIMAEGCSLLVLEELGHALARGATIHGEVLGVGIATDSYRLTDPEPGGRGMGDAMRNALRDAGLEPSAVDYINAHGTSTKMNDAAETLAMKRVFGGRDAVPPVSSSKSMFGHLIHAAGVTEAIVCLKSIAHGRIHPTINQTEPDPDCDLDYVPNVARDLRVRVAMNNSFGFGGQNVSLVLGAYDGSAA
jgi:3-oxoacyl-[acyl-carrier-protein] synthase II